MRHDLLWLSFFSFLNSCTVHIIFTFFKHILPLSNILQNSWNRTLGIKNGDIPKTSEHTNVILVPRGRALFVSTKHPDLWEGPIFGACGMRREFVSYSQPIRFSDLFMSMRRLTGNPWIADLPMQRSRFLVLTKRSAGSLWERECRAQIYLSPWYQHQWTFLFIRTFAPKMFPRAVSSTICI